MAIIHSGEQRLWAEVLCRAARDVCTQAHEPTFWNSAECEGIASTIGLDPARIRKWAGIVEIEL
jgi:hypothetical protein